VLLLTDGTVLAHSEPNCLNCTSTDYNSWYRLTPDTDFSTNVEVFTPAGTHNPPWAPTISSASTSIARGKTYTVSGTQFNGLSQGSAYGDDFQNATNYPLVRIVNAATGHVFYCRTHHHSTMAIATGSKKVSTQFDVPAGTETGLSQLFVVANGIPSSPYWVKVH
jgi:hypothetical protein